MGIAEEVKISLPTGGDVRLPVRVAARCTGKELAELCWEAIPGLKREDHLFWSIRVTPTASSSRDVDAVFNWLQLDKKLTDQGIKSRELEFVPRLYPEHWHQLQNVYAVELLFLSVKRAVYSCELRFTDNAKDVLAGYALQALIGDYRDESTSRSSLRRHYLVPVTKNLDHWAESERRAVHHHKKQRGCPRGKAITNYLMIATNQPTYGVELFRGVHDKNKHEWVVGVCYNGIHRYHVAALDNPDKIYDWKKLDNLYFKDKKFTVEVCSDDPKTPRSMSWYGRGTTIRALWNAAIHAHMSYIDLRSNKKLRHEFPKLIEDFEKKLDKPCLTNFQIPDIPLESQDGARLTKTRSGEESPERRAKELEVLIALKSKRRMLEDQYFQRVEQLKSIMRQEAQLTKIIPPEFKKYLTQEDKELNKEVINHAKTLQETTFKFEGLPQQQTDAKSLKKTSSVTSVNPVNRSDQAQEELRRIGKDLEVNKKITVCLSKLNIKKIENESKKQTYARKYQEQLFRKYKNKVTSLEETKNHLERIIITPSSPLSLSPDLPSDLKMSRISLDRGRNSIDDVGSVSSSSSLPDTDGHRISGSATPRSAHSTTSLEEVNAGPTRQYSIRRENGGPVISQSQRPPSPHSSTSESGSSHKAPPRRDRPPPVQERTSSLTPTLSRRTSQPLLSLPDGNVTLRPARKTYGDSGSATLTRGPIKVEHPASTIKTFSSAEIESRYCSSRATMSRGYSADPAFNNQNTNNHYYYGDSSGQYMHPGYGAMPRAPTEFDALSEMSFGSEANVNNIQSRKHIRQLLHEHFTRDTNRPNDSNPASSHHNYHNAPHATYQRTSNSRSHRSNNHTSSTHDAAFAEHNHREMHVGSITPGTKKRLPPSTLSLHSTQTNMDLGTPGTPSSLASSSGIPDSRTLSQNTFHRHDSGISTLSAQTHSTKTLSSQNSGGSLGYGVNDSGTEAAKRREILPEATAPKTTGLRNNVRSALQSQVHKLQSITNSNRASNRNSILSNYYSLPRSSVSLNRSFENDNSSGNQNIELDCFEKSFEAEDSTLLRRSFAINEGVVFSGSSLDLRDGANYNQAYSPGASVARTLLNKRFLGRSLKFTTDQASKIRDRFRNESLRK